MLLDSIPTATRALARSALTLSFFTFCGCGSPAEAEHPRPDTEPASDGSAERTLEPLDEGDPLANGPETASTKPAEPEQRCAEGQCFQCGETLCPDGYYCDAASAACGWLPECIGPKFSCACLLTYLEGCSCTDDDGHPTVECPSN